MTVREIKTFEIECEFCGTTLTFTTGKALSMAGWTTVTTHGWGMTDYSKSQDRCPQCTADKKGET